MKQLLIDIIKKTPLYYPLRNWVARRRQAKDLIQWENSGRPDPPPHSFKHQTIKRFAKRFGLKILVETGTYYGDMIEATKKDFDRIYSIELSKDLYEKAKKRFQNIEKIELLQGDSGVKLESVVKKLDQPALFWLDGHYSEGVTARGDKDTPVFEELEHIFNASDMGHVIIIDDARCFGTDADYPSIQELSDYVKSKRPDTDIAVKDDSIRITPQKVV